MNPLEQIAIIWAIGFVAAYALVRIDFLINKVDWTLTYRLKTLLFSLLSWLAFLIGILIIISDRIGEIDWNKKVKW